LSFQGIVSPSLLDRVRSHARVSTKPRESGVCDDGRAHVLPHTRGSHIPFSDRGDMSWRARRSMSGEIWCSSTPISPLFAVALRLGTTSLDPLRDLTHGGLCDPV
jgi:hypothetical protein